MIERSTAEILANIKNVKNGKVDKNLAAKIDLANYIVDRMGREDELDAIPQLSRLQNLILGVEEDDTPVYTLKRLIAEHPIMHPPIVDGLIREREVASIVSYSKIGKSWLMYSLALAVITGRPWLGKFATKPGKVLLIDYELHEATIANRIPRVAAAMEIPIEQIDEQFEIWPLRGRAHGLQQLETRLAAMQPEEFKLIIIDPKYRLLATDPDADENSNMSETRLFNVLDEIGRRCKAAIVLVHHMSKGEQGGKRVTDMGAGAGAQSRAADDHITLVEHEEENCVRLDVAVRSFPKIDPVVLRWEFPLWRVDENQDPNRIANPKTRGLRQRDESATELVRDALQRDNEGLTTNQLSKLTGMDDDRVAKGLKGLEGDVEIIDVQRNGRRYDGYRLVSRVA